MSNICRFTVPVSRDIEKIIDFIAGNSSFGAAERFLDQINQKCRNLANFPISIKLLLLSMRLRL